jgi:hypothetical protein
MAQKRKGQKRSTYGTLGARVPAGHTVPSVVDWVSERLRVLETQRVEVVGEQALTATHARSVGMTWEQIGAAVGITRQSAHQRWGRSA